MKKLIPVLLLLMTGCERPESQDASQTIALPDDLLANLQNATVAEDPARLQALIDRAMPAALPNAAKAQYQGVRAGVGGAACGEVATPGPNGRMGPYRRFVITPDAVAIIGTGPSIKFNDPSDFLADAWIRWCASPEELKLVESQLDQGSALVPDAPLQVAPPPIGEGPLPPTSKLETPSRTASASPPPPPATIDSFSKSISRPQ